ncbi:hypothetical protein EHYA_09554 [Embleya hyalina]|uniref:Uncharacterized protein n=1 Tax=Embleya hyalina TaxID=516124 RepID=A0A401Z4K9_9ACTN|nr:hypothetical protein EHYA_09554 [Embleya hyalina]
MDEGRLPADALPVRTCSAIEALTGPIHAVTPVDGGHHSDLAVRVDTATGPVFVKGLRAGDPRAAAQRREALIGECVAGWGSGCRGGCWWGVGIWWVSSSWPVGTPIIASARGILSCWRRH